MSRLDNSIEITNWRKSTFSDTNGSCVEVGSTRTVRGFRDTKQNGQGPAVLVGHAAGTAFLATVAAGDFTR